MSQVLAVLSGRLPDLPFNRHAVTGSRCFQRSPTINPRTRASPNIAREKVREMSIGLALTRRTGVAFIAVVIPARRLVPVTVVSIAVAPVISVVVMPMFISCTTREQRERDATEKNEYVCAITEPF